jgi:pyruvate formate lyase activating enzyme
LENNKIKCNLCNHRCILNNNQSGICNVRKNINGVFFSLVYGKIVAKHVDPVEKKPLYHFLPGTSTYSISTVGCNFKCLNCQNYEISQAKYIFGKSYTPAEIINEVKHFNIPSISYTYTEPTIYYETARDIGILANENNIKNIFVSNGFMSKEVVKDSFSWLHGINIDLKSFSENFYKIVCKGSLKPVLDNIIDFKTNNVWVEVTTLLIPGYNDSEEEIKKIADFLYSVDPAIPWHISAFYPTYKLTDAPFTSPDKVIKARLIGLERGLKYVYTGNIRYPEGESTFCYNCGKLLISRHGYSTEISNLKGNKCLNCEATIEGVFS